MGTASRVCTSCDTPLPPEAKFCLNCGVATPTEAGERSRAGVPSEDQFERLKAALLDRYRIERVLGQGGMATVYLAHDLRHERKVAVKVLRPELAAAMGSDRFLREIGFVAQLQHPHILMLIDSGEADGFLYYVMPFVEGESLRHKLVRERELPIRDTVSILHDVVDALAYAHSHGVVHRDIKPENVLLSGRHALVLDFGVAKAMTQAAGQSDLTTAGLSLGTPAYMAPEQAAADPKIDQRADIYAVGVMAYELLTGALPITGETPQAILAAQVTAVPEPVSDVRPTVPPPLAQLVMRCLEKRPADRWQSAEELLPQLEPLTTASGGVTPAGAQVATGWAMPVPSKTMAIVVGAAAIVIVAAAVVLTRGTAPPSVLAAPVQRQLTFDGAIAAADLSRDGQMLAYISAVRDTNRLFVQDLAGGTTVRLATLNEWAPGYRAGWTLRWRPDGTAVLYVGASGERRDPSIAATFARLGGSPRPLSLSRDQNVWSPDGSQVAGWGWDASESMVIKTLATGDSTVINMPSSAAQLWSGDWSPTGELIAVSTTLDGGAHALWTLRLDGSEWHRLVTDSLALSPPRWSSRGSEVFYLRGTELRSLRVTAGGQGVGTPNILLENLKLADGLPLQLWGAPSVTEDGRQLTYIAYRRYSNLWLAALDRMTPAGPPTQLTRGTTNKSVPAVSPDGQQVAYLQVEPGQSSGDLFVVPITGGPPRRITFGAHAVLGVAWSPDGTRLAFGSVDGGTIKVRTVSLAGRQERTYEATQPGSSLGGDVKHFNLAWAPGQQIVYTTPPGHNFQLLDPRTEAEEPLVTNESGDNMCCAHYSPDGDHIAVYWKRPNGGAWVISLRHSTQTLVRGGWFYPLGWTADGQSLYVQAGDSDDILVVPVTGGPGTVVATTPFEGARQPWTCMAFERAEGPGLLCNVEVPVSDVWMVENFDPRFGERLR